MISEIKEVKCKYCNQKELIPNRLKIERKGSKVFWWVKCGNCNEYQTILWEDETDNTKSWVKD